MLNRDKTNWYGFDHEVVKAKFDGSPDYVGTFCVRDEYRPVAVYRSQGPDRSKGHKDFILLHTQRGDPEDPTTSATFIRGMDAAEIEPYWTQAAIRCGGCREVIYSCMRHEERLCGCGAVSIDGGRDYEQITLLKDGVKPIHGVVDFRTGEFKLDLAPIDRAVDPLEKP